jgi:urease accessory protein
MASDAKAQRGERPFVFTNLRTGDGVDRVIEFVTSRGLLDALPRAGAR